MGDWAADIRSARTWFWGLAALAIALRVLAFDPYSAHHQDETIQYLEQAHRIVFGYGFVPWEYRYFIRSWLIPLLLVPPMQLGEWLDPGGTLYLILPRAMVAAANFTPVIAAWFIGKRISTAHAIVGMAVMALWIESVLFSVQTLSESLSVACFFGAVALLHREARFGAIVAAGALMALAGLFRFQFGPAIALYAVLIAGTDRRVWAALMLGGLPVVAGGGLLDIAMGLRPYEWILNNYNANITQGRMKEIGGHDVGYYLKAIPHFWKWAVVPIFIFLLHGWRRNPALFAAALINIAVHQFVGHKEYRYLWLSIDALLLLAAFGSVDFLKLAKLPKWAGILSRNPIGWAVGFLGDPVIEPGFDADLPNGLARGRRTVPAGGGNASRPQGLRPCGAVGSLCTLRICAAPPAQAGLPGSASVSRRPGEIPHRPAPAFNAMLCVGRRSRSPRASRVKGDCMGSGDDRLCAYRRPGGCTLDERSLSLEYQRTLSRLNM